MTNQTAEPYLEGNISMKVIIAFLVVIFTLAVYIFYQRKRAARNCILFTGLCDSGKTLLFAQLVHKKYVQTHTSIRENIGSYNLKNKYLKIVDIPGHERLRDKFLEQFKAYTRGIVFVIDSLTIQQDIKDAAEFLYNILVDPVIASNSPHILILCNKQDQALAKGSGAVKSILEKELNTLRITKSRQLESVDPKLRKATSLGDSGTDFSFSSVHLKVDFAESCAFNKSDSIHIDELTKWLANIV